ncbi:MAG: NUDIX domain-containing protein [Phycisphaerae bacterium]|nr:NUDIX domain-containing protein [Phycisphaerae bacterium]
MAEERVLVVERRIVEEIGAFHGLNFDVDAYLSALFAPGAGRFMPRAAAENNPDYKQLIPYVIMTHEGKYLTYVRGKRAGETRLVGNRSIGIGGHINPVDAMPLLGDFGQTYLEAVRREVAEETTLDAGHTDHIVALLNDDSNDVGKVHLGVVHYWTLDAVNVRRREQMITQMTFMTPDELRGVRDTMETWSQLCLDGLDRMAEKARTGVTADALFSTR